jgi:hypothetical protein
VIAKIFFDSALPDTKTPVRISRLEDSLRKLITYRNRTPNLRFSGSRSVPSSENFFQRKRPSGGAGRQSLPAPPFIVAAALSALKNDERMETVPGEADGYLAAAAISSGGGIVLTGDSDLLVFDSAGRDWGVLFLQDFDFFGSTRVFRPQKIKERLRFPLVEVAWQTAADPTVALSVVLRRLERMKLRRVAGAVVEEVPLEFRREYELPAPHVLREVVDARIGELLHLAERKVQGRMYLPLLWDDPQRASAWKCGAGIRALAYGMLFDQPVEEVLRRGQRMVVAEAAATADVSVTSLAAVVGNGVVWLVVDLLLSTFRTQGQDPPRTQELEVAAASLLPVTREGKKVGGGWSTVHVLAMAQAAWYSLLMLREVLVYKGLRHELRQALEQLPNAMEIFEVACVGSEAQTVVRKALERYSAELLDAQDDIVNENTDENGVSDLQRKRVGACENEKEDQEEMEIEGEALNDKERVTGQLGGNMFAVLEWAGM